MRSLRHQAARMHIVRDLQKFSGQPAVTLLLRPGFSCCLCHRAPLLKVRLSGLGDLRLIGGEPEGDDVAQRPELLVVDIFPFVLGEAKQKNSPIGPNSNEHTKAASLSLPRPCHPLLDDVTAKISIDQATRRTFDGGCKAGVADALLPRKLRKIFGLEDAHNLFYNTMNYSIWNDISSRKLYEPPHCPGGRPAVRPRKTPSPQSSMFIGSG